MSKPQCHQTPFLAKRQEPACAQPAAALWCLAGQGCKWDWETVLGSRTQEICHLLVGLREQSARGGCFSAAWHNPGVYDHLCRVMVTLIQDSGGCWGRKSPKITVGTTTQGTQFQVAELSSLLQKKSPQALPKGGQRRRLRARHPPALTHLEPSITFDIFCPYKCFVKDLQRANCFFQKS